jgi:hypothetical protein
MAVSPARAQSNKALDTVKLRYNLKQGETVTYRAISYDSIIIYDARWRTLARERVEMITFTCDSVLRDGYIITATTQQYAATEKLDTMPPVTRTDHPWVERPVTFLMDPAGRRVDLVAGDTVVANAPGGPFSPLLFPHLGTGLMYVGQSATFTNEQWLAENSFPPVRWSGTTFRVIEGRTDTMGHKGAIHISMTDAATVAHKVPGNETNPLTRTVISGGGDYYFDPKLGYPLGGEYNQIARFTMEFPGNKTVDGRHLTGMYYELVKNQ